MSPYQTALSRLSTIASNANAINNLTKQNAEAEKVYEQAFAKATPEQQNLLNETARELNVLQS